MKYVIATKEKAKDHGFDVTIGRRTKGDLVLLNEKEVMNCQSLKGNTLGKRATELDGKAYTEKQVITELNKGGWN